jgi:hypothetical protein
MAFKPSEYQPKLVAAVANQRLDEAPSPAHQPASGNGDMAMKFVNFQAEVQLIIGDMIMDLRNKDFDLKQVRQDYAVLEASNTTLQKEIERLKLELQAAKGLREVPKKSAKSSLP